MSPMYYGCRDSHASNYDPTANAGDDSVLCVRDGCVVPTADNYDSKATRHDFSCEYSVPGCMDSDKLNYNPIATVDDQSCVSRRPGCGLPVAINYDSLANADDGSCQFYIVGCTNPAAINYYSAANTNDGSCILPVDGCLSPIARNYNSKATVDDGSCEYAIRGCTDSLAVNYLPQADEDDGSCEPRILGCMVPSAINFDSSATAHDKACRFERPGCMDSTSANFDPLAVVDVGCDPLVAGCVAPTALNFNSLANLNDGTCIFAIKGCTDSTATNFLPAANMENTAFPCQFLIHGCLSPSAINYDPTATAHDNSCIYERLGCTSSSAANYVTFANVDDGTCVDVGEGCLDPVAENYDSAANTYLTGSCSYVTHGCMESVAVNYNPLAVQDDGSCRFGGCTDSSASNYDPTAAFDDGSCVPFVVGCLDSRAINYVPDAHRPAPCFIFGCTSSLAVNYQADATDDDQSCIIQRASATVASFGYLQSCDVFVDANGNLVLDGAEIVGATSSVGYYSVIYKGSGGPVQAQRGPAAACIDSITGTQLGSALRTTVTAHINSPLTTIAYEMLASRDEAAASDITCRNTIPCVSCVGSLQPCIQETQCVDTCSLRGQPISVFSFNALSAYLLGEIPDPAWAAWLVAQVNTAFTVVCAQESLLCASPDLCAPNCEALCGSNVGSFSAAEVSKQLYATLADMTLAAPLRLEDASGAVITQLITRGSQAFGVSPRDEYQQIATSCGQTNALTFQVLTTKERTRRRRMQESDGTASPVSDAVGALSELCLARNSSSDCDLKVGCMRPQAANFDPTARLPSNSCIIHGCTSPFALNFDQLATHDDGSCTKARVYSRHGLLLRASRSD
jgi:hypothetical protein